MLETTGRAAARLRQSLDLDRERVARVARLAGDALDPDDLRAADALIQRYQQLLEHLTHRLLAAVYRRESLGERPPDLRTLLAIYEGRSLIDRAADWQGRIELRNRLVHEYPIDESDRGADLMGAVAEAERMLADVDRIRAYVRDHHLLAGDDDD